MTLWAVAIVVLLVLPSTTNVSFSSLFQIDPKVAFPRRAQPKVRMNFSLSRAPRKWSCFMLLSKFHCAHTVFTKKNKYWVWICCSQLGHVVLPKWFQLQMITGKVSAVLKETVRFPYFCSVLNPTAFLCLYHIMASLFPNVVFSLVACSFIQQGYEVKLYCLCTSAVHFWL